MFNMEFLKVYLGTCHFVIFHFTIYYLLVKYMYQTPLHIFFTLRQGLIKYVKKLLTLYDTPYGMTYFLKF